MLHFVVVYVLARRRVLVMCEETHQLVDPLMRMEEREAAVRSVEGCVGCEDGQWRGGLVKRVRIHALGHFVLHACNCDKMFCSVDSLRRHRVKCRLFSNLYGQTGNLLTPIFVVCACRHIDLLQFLRANGWAGLEQPPFPPLLPITRKTVAIEQWQVKH